MRYWAGFISAERYAAERLYAFETIAFNSVAIDSGEVSATDSADADIDTDTDVEAIDRPVASRSPRPGDGVALVAVAEVPVLFGLGVVVEPTVPPGLTGTGSHQAVEVRYTHRIFDYPVPVDPQQLDSGLSTGLTPLAEQGYKRLAARVPERHTDASKSDWLVSVAIPIEASSRAEAVREFWTLVRGLGPRELPAYVWPRGDELAMQAFVLGEQANLDPEADE